ncbi:MAG: cadmium-translocating P-type ATPase [Pseudomonadota bacterium]
MKPAPVLQASSLRCYHCGETVQHPVRWQVRVAGVDQPLCCAGCQAVASVILEGGLQRYYSARAEVSPTPRPAVAAKKPDLVLYDAPEVTARYVRSQDGLCETHLLIEGLRCSACVWLLEQGLIGQPGVDQAQINLSTERALLRWDPAQVRLSQLLARVRALGYEAKPFDAKTREQAIQRQSRSSLRRLFIAGISMMQVMMYAAPAYFAQSGDIDPSHQALMQWASLLLTLPVVLFCATPIFAGAWRDALMRRLGMDVPVSLGIIAAFAASVWACLVGHGDVYFDTVTMFVFLLLAARHLEWSARRRASRSVDALAAALPDCARRIVGPGASTELVPAERLVPGDHIVVAVGERIPVDARVLDESACIDQSLMTGESVPVEKIAGSELPGGAINVGHPIRLEVLRPLHGSTLSNIEQLALRAASERTPLAAAADRIARHFTAALLLLALAIYACWNLIDADRALPIALAVLVVSCPCALSLATPAALAAAIGHALRRGILVTRHDALEALAGVSHVVFDKTGTLTRGEPQLLDIVSAADQHLESSSGKPTDAAQTDDWLAIAAALEHGQSHPLAKAIVQAAHRRHIKPAPARALKTQAGSGVEGEINGQRWRIGRHAAAPSGYQAQTTEAWLFRHDEPVARLRFRDTLRAEAADVMDALRARRLTLHLLSGDHSRAADAVGAQLGIRHIRAGASPDDKLDYVRTLQAQGHRVLMVGDGINDAPVLACADVSVAVGDATALAQTSASVVLLNQGLDRLPALIDLARRTRNTIRHNLAWALIYNGLVIPAAALGWISPWVAALGMSLSSLLVVANAARLLIERSPDRGASARKPVLATAAEGPL